MWVDFNLGGQQEMDFFIERSIIMDYGLIFCLEVMI